MKLGDFSLAEDRSAAERWRARVEAFNRNATPYPRDATVPARFAEMAARRPEAVAVIDGEEQRTYREVAERAARIAGFLARHGLEPEGMVGVMADTAFDLVTALLGALQAGGAYLPLDADMPPARAAYMLRDTRARFLIGGRRHIRRLNRLHWECPDLAVLLCPDSGDVHAESEGIGEFMREDVWDHSARQAFDDISGGGWKSSFTGEWLSREVMDEYGDNIRRKLAPRLRPDSRVLEIGCASGISLFRLAPGVAYYHGTDLSGEILRWTAAEVERRGLTNVRLQHVPAHETDRVPERDFDCVILNSVVQCFSGHNYLRRVIRQAIDRMAPEGVIFLGNIWDQEKQSEFERELEQFQRANPGRGYRIKTDRDEDLFLPRAFWEDLRAEWPEIAEIEYSGMLGSAESELSRFGYDAILTIRRAAPAGSSGRPRSKRQFDHRALREAAAPIPGKPAGPRSLAYAIYTSGTSGQPKGVLVEHRSILRLVLRTNYIDLGPSDRILMTGAASFDASTFEIWGALLNGGTLCRPPERGVLDAAVMKRLLAEHGITTLWLTAGLCNQLADADPALFAGLKTLLTGGERVSAPHLRRIRAANPRLTLVNGYGPTENTTFTACHVIEGQIPDDVPIGRPIANTRVYVLEDGMELAPPGVTGEIYTGGDGLARGYLNDEALTREKFVADPFHPGERLYRTGDLGRWREDGVLEFAGRRDDQVKIRGFRVEPAEIEARLRSHESVREAVVVARDLGSEGRILVAYVDEGAAVDPLLREFLGRTLPDYMIPSRFVRLPALPLSPNGKVDRRALPAPPEAGAEAAAPEAPPRGEVERTLAAIWEEVLGRRGIGATENFFAAGGHSLKVTKLAALIRRRLGVELPITALFKAVTVRDQADLLVNAVRFGVKGIDEPMVPLNAAKGGEGRIFLFPPGTGDALGYVQLAGLLEPHACLGFNFLEAESRLRDYADLIAGADPEGPHVLFGFSAGGNLAYHVAAELEGRGRQVAAVIMVDSGRVRRPIVFPPGEAERVTEDFLGHESIRPYVATPVLREKAARLIARYYEYMARTVDDKVVAADLYNLVCDEAGEHYDDEGRLFVSRRGWAEATRGRYVEVAARGDHRHMLMPPHLEANAGILRELCANIFRDSKRALR